MIENSCSVSTGFEPLPRGSEAAWAGHEFGAKRNERGGVRILLVEDEEPLRACVRMMLELEGHEVTEASNGVEALNLFSIGEFDLVITDYHMPVMEGNKLATGIKLVAPSLPILMITAFERAHRDARNPVDALLNKPFTVTELHSALRRVLSARPTPIQPGAAPAVPAASLTFDPEETDCRRHGGMAISC